MKKNNVPKARFFSEPFIDGYTDIEKTNFNMTIGDSNMRDDIFANACWPEYISCICELEPISEFENIEILSKILAEYCDESSINFKLYSGENIKMKGFISQLNINCRDIFSLEPEQDIPPDWRNFMKENPKIYEKCFQIQSARKEIEVFVDENLETSDMPHFKSNAHFFAGSYYSGIEPSNVQQYLFFIGTDVYSEKYISVISAQDLLRSNAAAPTPDVKLNDLSTLQDEACSGNIRIIFPDDICYNSIDIMKNTLVSNYCKIIFKLAES
ncbi:hypothetical protein FACS1894113_4850 [Alphaproteobacteria bacterium]|nr:hypothetical protein FACS1894113_4850 [Alphaproteobacteria bacterium]